MNAYLASVIENVKAKHGNEPEFVQTVEEVFSSLEPVIEKHPEYEKISTQNKINFIGGSRELSECIVYGLYVLFNSTFYDCYYRILNGSTQVNSTEVNTMPVPPLATIEAMGKELLRCHDASEMTCDNIVRSFIYAEDRGSENDSERIASAS